MTEKDTSEITAGNQDKIWLLSNLRYIPKKNLIPVPYKNAGKERTCSRTGGAFSAPGFSGVQDKNRWDCAAFILPKVCVANFRINCCSRWKLALRVHFITEQLKKSNRKSLGSFASDFSHWLFYGRKKNELVSSKIAGSAVEKCFAFEQLYLLPRDERKFGLMQGLSWNAFKHSDWTAGTFFQKAYGLMSM